MFFFSKGTNEQSVLSKIAVKGQFVLIKRTIKHLIAHAKFRKKNSLFSIGWKNEKILKI